MNVYLEYELYLERCSVPNDFDFVVFLNKENFA